MPHWTKRVAAGMKSNLIHGFLSDMDSYFVTRILSRACYQSQHLLFMCRVSSYIVKKILIVAGSSLWNRWALVMLIKNGTKIWHDVQEEGEK